MQAKRAACRERSGSRPKPRPYTLHHTPCTLHSTPCTLHPAPCTLHPTPYTLHPTPHTLRPTPYTPHPAPYTLHPTPYTRGMQENEEPLVPNSDPKRVRFMLWFWGAGFSLNSPGCRRTRGGALRWLQATWGMQENEEGLQG